MRRPFTALVVAALVGCAQPELASLLDGSTWVDLSHDFSGETIYWPTARPFALEVVSAGVVPAGFYYAANNFCAAEHGGTHLDAPIHFAEGRRTAEALPVEQLAGPAVVVDVSTAAAADPDYRLTADDVARWEAAHGPIRAGAIVLVRTGWASRWPDRARYLGTARTGPQAVAELRFPGVHPDAARLLVERRVGAVGIDTPSIDFGRSTTFDTHQVLLAENIPAFENVAALDRVPTTGAYVIALPMKIRGGSGGPLRIVAVVP